MTWRVASLEGHRKEFGVEFLYRAYSPEEKVRINSNGKNGN